MPGSEPQEKPRRPARRNRREALRHPLSRDVPFASRSRRQPRPVLTADAGGAEGRDEWPLPNGAPRFNPKQPVIELDGDRDLFGDGSVTLISTPGHSPGHQCLLVRLPRPAWCSSPVTPSTRAPTGTAIGLPERNFNVAQSLASLDRMAAVLKENNAQLWIGHEVKEVPLRANTRRSITSSHGRHWVCRTCELNVTASFEGRRRRVAKAVQSQFAAILPRHRARTVTVLAGMVVRAKTLHVLQIPRDTPHTASAQRNWYIPTKVPVLGFETAPRLEVSVTRAALGKARAELLQNVSLDVEAEELEPGLVQKRSDLRQA